MPTGGLPVDDPDIFHPDPADTDEVRAVRDLLGLYRELYLRRSEAHRVILTELGKRLIAWQKAGRDRTRRPVLSRAELRAALVTADASCGDDNIDRLLQQIGLDLSILGTGVTKNEPIAASTTSTRKPAPSASAAGSASCISRDLRRLIGAKATSATHSFSSRATSQKILPYQRRNLR
jgi:hypothetical protein